MVSSSFIEICDGVSRDTPFSNFWRHGYSKDAPGNWKKSLVNNDFCSLFTQITLPWPTPPPTERFAFSHECLQVWLLRYSSVSLCTQTEVRYYLQNSHQELSHVYMVLDFYLWRGWFSDIVELSLCYCLVSCVVMLLAELKTINSIWR